MAILVAREAGLRRIASSLTREASVFGRGGPFNAGVVLGFRRWGTRPTAVINGAEAVEAMECGSFDLVLMDLRRQPG